MKMNAMKVNLVVMGYGGSGKDSACEILSKIFGLTYVSSSWAVSDIVVFPVLKEKYGYETSEQCFSDRRNRRAEWYEAIQQFNTPDKARLAREIFRHADVYCGLRCAEEFKAAKDAGLFEFSLWIDASKRIPAEPVDSCTVTPDMADLVIDNNGLSDDLLLQVYGAMQKLREIKNKRLADQRRSASGKIARVG